MIRRMVVAAIGMLCLIVAALVMFSRATAWDPLRSKDAAVEAGNHAMQEGHFKSALSHYDKAAKTLPSSPGVQLDRGLALRSAKDATMAQQAFTTATELRGRKSVRAEAFYNLGIGEYQRGEALVAKRAFKDAQPAFTQAAKAFKQALRLAPGHKHAAWNLELALRQLDEAREQERKQQEQDKQPDKPDDKGDESKPQANQDPSSSSPPKSAPEPDQKKGEQPSPPNPQPGDAKEQEPVLPSEAERVLDTLQQREENLERHKARIRALQDDRRPAKDW